MKDPEISRIVNAIRRGQFDQFMRSMLNNSEVTWRIPHLLAKSLEHNENSVTTS